MRSSLIVALGLLAIICSACGLVTLPTPPSLPGATHWPENPAGTPLPGAVPTASIALPATPPTAPAGPFPSLLAEINLSSPLGNGFQPIALALDEAGLAYIICQGSDLGPRGQACIVRADPTLGSVLNVWPLPGKPSGPLAVGGGRLYVYYRDSDDRRRLAVLDATTGQMQGDLDASQLGSQEQPGLDVAGQRLYLPADGSIEVRDLEAQRVLARLAYPLRAVDCHVVYDLASDRIYVSLSNVLLAYQASDLRLLWQTDAPVERITALALDASGEFLLAQGATEGQQARRALLYTTGGKLADTIAQGAGEDGQIVWADAQAGRLIYWEAVSSASGAPSRLWSADWAGQPTTDTLPLAAGATVYVPARARNLYVLGRWEHTLMVVAGANLDPGRAIPLGVELRGLVVDHSREKIYANDSAARLYAIDMSGARQGKLVVECSAVVGSGNLALDAAGETLLVSQAGGDVDGIGMVDPDSLQVTQVITGGNLVALDTRRARAIVSSPINPYPPFAGRAYIWDLARRELVGVIEEGGKPAYNPLRDEIYLAGYGCHVYDAGTLERVGSLTPDIDAQACPGCTGQPAVADVSVYSALNALVLHMTVTNAGKGGGTLPAPRILTLDTLQPKPHQLTMLPTRFGEYLVWPAIDGRVYEQASSWRQAPRANLVTRDAQSGEVLSWRDGLALEMFVPESEMGFVERGGQWLALDTADWTPLGYIPRYSIYSYDAVSNWFYTLEGSRLGVLSPSQGNRLLPGNAQRATLREGIRALAASPAYAEDETLFATTAGSLYRSRTGGQSWELLGGGLPQLEAEDGAYLAVAVSPAFGRDQTLFAGGGYGGGQGAGVWRSIDGGDTWQPVWRGLAHLRVKALALSPDYPADKALLAYCQYDDLAQADSGRSLWQSQDGGEHWEMLAQVSDAKGERAPLPDPEEVWEQTGQRLPLRAARNNRVVELDTGTQWHEVLRLAPGELLVGIWPAPDYAMSQTIYALSTQGLYRSTDGGATWERGSAPTLEHAGEGRFTAIEAVAGAGDGALLLVGDSEGRVQTLRPDEISWIPRQ